VPVNNHGSNVVRSEVYFVCILGTYETDLYFVVNNSFHVFNKITSDANLIECYFVIVADGW